jgi:phosphohistidine phosphatase
MLLYLLRHGDARPKSEDPERGLSDRGRAEVAAVCRVFARIDPRIETIWHSGKTRAEETATFLASTLKMEKRVAARSGLDPNDPLPPLVDELNHRKENLAIVGHLPQLAKLVSALLCASRTPFDPRAPRDTERPLLDFPSAGLACLERSEGQWLLRWFLSPELCPDHNL